VVRFAAHRSGASVVVSWRTASELGAAGYNVYRSVGSGPFRKVNPKLVAAKASGSAHGAAYRLVDRAAPHGTTYTYRLQIVDRAGKRSWQVGSSTAS
jgi:hypothetical protein